MQFASVIGRKGAAGGFDGVVVRHRPDVSKDERGFRNWVAVERFITGPCHRARNTAALDGDVEGPVERHRSVCLVGCDVHLRLTQPRHVGHLTENGGEFVDLPVVVGFGEQVSDALAVRTVPNVVSRRSCIEHAGECRNADASSRNEEFVVAFIVGVHKPNWNPVGFFVVVHTVLTGERIALDEKTNARKGFTVVAQRDLTGQTRTGVVLQNLHVCVDVPVVDVSLGYFAVPVGDNEVIHHGAGKREGCLEEGSRGSSPVKVLGGLRVAGANVETQRGSTVSNVGSSDHRIEEGRIVVDSDVFDLQHVNVRTRLLIQEILLHGFVDFLAGHLVLEVTSDGFVDLVHVGGDVLSCQDGRCAENTHRLSAVVLCISGVSTGFWIETVVDRKVANFVVASDGFTGCALIVLNPVEAFQTDEVVVEVVDGGGRVRIERFGQQLHGHCQTGVLSVNRG